MLAFPLAEWEREGLAAALARAGLPADDVQAPSLLFWRFEHGDFPAGFGGLEVQGDHALLRSIVTMPPLRRQGIGAAIVATLEAEARLHECRNVWVLAPFGGEFFFKHGYVRRPHGEAPKAFRASPPFTAPSAAASVLMTKRLD